MMNLLAAWIYVIFKKIVLNQINIFFLLFKNCDASYELFQRNKKVIYRSPVKSKIVCLSKVVFLYYEKNKFS